MAETSLNTLKQVSDGLDMVDKRGEGQMMLRCETVASLLDDAERLRVLEEELEMLRVTLDMIRGTEPKTGDYLPQSIADNALHNLRV